MHLISPTTIGWSIEVGAPEIQVVGRSPIQAFVLALGALSSEFTWDPGQGLGFKSSFCRELVSNGYNVKFTF